MDNQLLVDSLSKSLISWYHIPPECSVYYVTGSTPEFENDTRYDVIVVLEEVEKSNQPIEYIKKCKEHLNALGRLFLAVNNRFALKYFCGDRDPYTGSNFDGIEGYKQGLSNQEEVFKGRCYSKAEWKEMLEAAGIDTHKFYSVFQDLKKPCLIYADGFMPNEDLSSRLFPLYNCPETIFLEEREIYDAVAKNDMLHQMAEAYLIECSFGGQLSDVLQVTSSMERGEENALFTVIHASGRVEKRAIYQKGKARILQLSQHSRELSNNGIQVVEHEIVDDAYIMPYIKDEIGQVYLKRILREDQQLFLKELDHFRDLIMKSSQIVKDDAGNGEGVILENGYMDMVPLNSFHKEGTFVFFDQEFKVPNLPANVLLWRMIATMYYGDKQMNSMLPMDVLLERYDLKRNLTKWQEIEWSFLSQLRNENQLKNFYKKYCPDVNIIFSNRRRMNYSEDNYQKLFVDIFYNTDSRKILLFGSGAYAKHFLSAYRFDCSVDALIDNDPNKWGTKLNGIPIVSPDSLRDLPDDSYKVIICVKNYKPIMQQLDALGVTGYSIYEKGREYPRRHCVREIETDRKKSSPKKYHVGYVAGAFDMFHIGHVNLLRKAKEQCDYLIVGVLSDQGIYNLKKKYPIIPAEDRVAVIQACKYADLVEELPVDKMGILDAYETYHFDVQFSGNDHANDPVWLSEQAYLRERGSDIVFFDYTQKVSSSMLREKIKGD